MNSENNKSKSIASWRSLWKRIHQDEQGAVSIETVLIIAAIALPILIFIITIGWPRIVTFFNRGMDNLENNANNVGAGK